MKSERMASTHKHRAANSTGQELRAVGQGLESLDVEDFDLTTDVEGYFALATRRVSTPTSKTAVRKVVRIVGKNFSGHRRGRAAAPCVWVVVSTPGGILRRDRRERNRRKPQSAG